jgi:CO dehydrogenase maturation factor
VIVAILGKGGVGKTTVTALLLRRLLEANQTPVLAVDADPSSCLGSALGLSVTATLGAVREELRTEEARPASMSKADWLALQAEEALVERQGYDLLTMGRGEGRGCYCFINNLIREHLDRLSRHYRHVLVDCEAGIEHLSRRTAGRPDALICVTNRSRMAAETVRRALAVYLEIHGERPARLDLVLNGFGPDEPLARSVLGSFDGTRFDTVLHVPTDEALPALEAAGRSILELSPTSPALRALSSWEIGA